ncbi:MAG: DctP family TRAP transporter solute-binding subunit [Magnetococcales bacterium]|nr:DctP family TRAP transporter solute-binding subunit [Magnetococcales bacterium]
MKKNNIIAVLSVILVLIIIVLSYRIQSRRHISPTSQPTHTTSEVQSQRLRLGLNIPPGTALYAAAERFAQRVADDSHHSIQISVHPNQELGTDNQMLEMARRGELDLVLIPTAKFSTTIPAMQVLDLPFLFPSRQLLYQALDGQLGAMLLERLDNVGLKGLTFWENGFKQWTANRSLRTPEDFGGLKMRIMNSRILQNQFESLGASAIPIDFHTTRQALADRVVDGQENPLVAIVSMGFHEVQSHLTLSHHAYLGYVFAMSKSVFERLSTPHQQVVVTAARALTAWEREETQRYEATFLETIRSAGVQIHTLSDGERQRFQQALAHLPRKFERLVGPDVMAKVQQIIAQERLATANISPLIIGLDADLSSQSVQVGLAVKQGAELAIDDINQQGGVLGRPLLLMAKDHRGMPERGRDNLRAFADQANLVAIIGGKGSDVIRAELDLIQQLQVPYLIPWAAAAELVDNGQKPNFVFRASLNDRLVIPFLTDRAVVHGDRMTIVFENTAWGRNGKDLAQAHLSQIGQQPAHVVGFPTGTKDFQEVVAQIGASRANVVLLIAAPKSGKAFLKVLFQAVPTMPVIAHWGFIGDAFTTEESSLLAEKNVFFPQTIPLHAATPLWRQTLARYQHYFHTDTTALLHVSSGFAHAYDLLQLLAIAMREAGTTDRQAIRDALEHIKVYHGLVKNYANPFTAEQHDALSMEDYQLTRFLKDGAMPQKGLD